MHVNKGICNINNKCATSLLIKFRVFRNQLEKSIIQQKIMRRLFPLMWGVFFDSLNFLLIISRSSSPLFLRYPSLSACCPMFLLKLLTNLSVVLMLSLSHQTVFPCLLALLVLLKSFSSDWDLNSMFKNLNSMCKNLNLSKTLLGTPTHSLLIRITHLVSGFTEAQVLSVRGKVIGRK